MPNDLMTMNDHLEGVSKEAVVGYLELHSYRLYCGFQYNHEETRPRSEPGMSRIKAAAFALATVCLMCQIDVLDYVVYIQGVSRGVRCASGERF